MFATKIIPIHKEQAIKAHILLLKEFTGEIDMNKFTIYDFLLITACWKATFHQILLGQDNKLSSKSSCMKLTTISFVSPFCGVILCYHTHLLPDTFCSESVLPKHNCYKRDDKTKVCKVRFRSVTADHGLSMRYFPIPVRTFVDILLILQMYCISLCLPLNMHAVRWSYVVSVIELANRIHDMNVDLAASTSLSSRYTLTYYGHDFFSLPQMDSKQLYANADWLRTQWHNVQKNVPLNEQLNVVNQENCLFSRWQ